MDKEIKEYINGNKQAILEQLFELLKIPSISTDSKYKNDMHDCARYLSDELVRVGLDNVGVYNTKGHSVVYGDWLHAEGKPTLLIYGHYDVQPADPLDLWESSPFEPEIRDDQIYARGVSDDKGQVFCHIKAIESYLRVKGSLPVNIKLLIEGEEEIGSPGLEAFVEENKELLSADVLLVSDNPMFAEDEPSVCFSLRGLCYAEVIVEGASADLHSGQHGGPVPNPINALANIISKLKDENGNILIPHFYDDVATVSEDISEAIGNLKFDEAAYKKELGVDELVGEVDYSVLEKLWFRPTLDCNGIVGGYIGEGMKTIIPSVAKAKISMRLVVNQNPEKTLRLFEDYVNEIKPPGVKVKVVHYGKGNPLQTSIYSRASKSAARAIEKVYGKPAVFQGEGGSIPIIETIQKILNTETIFLGFNLPNDQIHAPNERFSLKNFYNGIMTSAQFLHELALRE
jgi:acetylornithine deacetylase/succinyl-diaminopimelate desuccinylase-like protein